MPRFSSDNQRSESIDAQVRAMKEYCKRKNIEIVDIYVDEAKSATTDKRPAFQQMIADSAKKTFDIVLVHKLDRFSRNRYDSAFYRRQLKMNGVNLCSVLENLDDSPESIILESVLEGMAEFYSSNLRRETLKGMNENALKAQHLGGKAPLGFDVDKETRKLIVNEHEAEAVRLIFQRYTEGAKHIDIVNELNSKGYKTKKGKEFLKNSLYSIPTNPKYAGYYVFNRASARSPAGTRNTHLLKDKEEIIVVEDGCPIIVDRDTYNKAQELITKNKHLGGRYHAKENYLLTGKVRCKDCGRSMSGSRTRGGRNKGIYVTYACRQKYCHNKAINKAYLEHYVINLLEREIFNEKAMRMLIERIRANQECDSKDTEAEKQRISKEIEAVEQRIQEMIKAISSGFFSAALAASLQEAEEQSSQLKNQLRRLEYPCPEMDLDIAPQLVPAQYAQVKQEPESMKYKEFLQSFVDYIEVGRFSVTIRLKTGLERCPELDSSYCVRRQEIYEAGSAAQRKE